MGTVGYWALVQLRGSEKIDMTQASVKRNFLQNPDERGTAPPSCNIRRVGCLLSRTAL